MKRHDVNRNYGTCDKMPVTIFDLFTTIFSLESLNCVLKVKLQLSNAIKSFYSNKFRSEILDPYCLF
jgi:hypothetical protein